MNIFLDKIASNPPKWEDWAHVNTTVIAGINNSEDSDLDTLQDLQDILNLIYDEGLDLDKFLDDIIVRPDTSYRFPKDSLNAMAFWVESVICHKQLKWTWHEMSEFSSDDFPINGEEEYQEYDQPVNCFEKKNGNENIKRLGLGFDDFWKHYEMSYSIGSLFKQDVYPKLEFEQKLYEDPECSDLLIKLHIESSPEVVQNSILKRVFVKEGLITKYISVDAEGGIQQILSIDLDEDILSRPPRNVESIIGTNITIYNEDGESREFEIIDIKDNWDIVVDAEESDEFDIKGGNYYVLDSGSEWIIRDTYLGSGFLEDSDPELQNSTTHSLKTTHNITEYLGKIKGVYVWTGCSGGVSVAYREHGMEDRDGSEWAWVSFPEGQPIDDEDRRYKQHTLTAEESNVEDKIGKYIRYTERSSASMEDFELYYEISNYARIDIGPKIAHNFAQGCLSGGFVHFKGGVYRILSCPADGIIDVQKRSLNGAVDFMPSISDRENILVVNQKWWMINEHYDGFPPEECVQDEDSGYDGSSGNQDDKRWSSAEGFLRGEILSHSFNEETSQTTIELKTNGDKCGAWRKNHKENYIFPATLDESPWKDDIELFYYYSNNFINRFRMESPEELGIKTYNKFDGWCFTTVNKDRWSNVGVRSYPIIVEQSTLSNISSMPYTTSRSGYTLSLVISGRLNDLDGLITNGFITFGPVVKTSCWSPENILFHLNYACGNIALPDICDVSLDSAGGPEGYHETFNVFGLDDFTLVIEEFKTYTIKDRLIINGDGEALYDSGFVATDKTGVIRGVEVLIAAGVSELEVIVDPGPEGTLWTLKVGCVVGDPEDKSDQSSESGCPTCSRVGETTTILLDGGFLTNQYVLNNIPRNTNICCLSGAGFGIDKSATEMYGVVSDVSAKHDEMLYLHISTVKGAEITTAGGGGLSAIYDIFNQSQIVLFEDPDTKKLTIRSGALKFRENPDKFEVFIGESKRVNPTGTDPIEFDSGDLDGYRLNRLAFKVGEGEEKITLSVNDPLSYYGTPISGKGKIDLQALRRDGQDIEAMQANVFLDQNGLPVSPVYVYQKGEYQGAENLGIGLSVNLRERHYSGGGYVDGSPTRIYVNRDVGEVKGVMAREVDVLGGGSGFTDIFLASDGSFFILYTMDVGPFILKENVESDADEGPEAEAVGSLENSSLNNKLWQRQKAVMMVQTREICDVWTTPFKFEVRKPLMILNGVDYLSSVYNMENERLLVFVKCYNIPNADVEPVDEDCGHEEETGDQQGYIGCFTINLLKTSHLYLECEPVDESTLNPDDYI